jgi:anaphase-promoting complex subunit 5
MFYFYSLELNCILHVTINLNVQGVCHLLNNIGIYCKEELSSCPPYEETGLDDSSSNLETYSEYENMDLENFFYEKVSEEIEARKEASERVPFHFHTPNALLSLVDGMSI